MAADYLLDIKGIEGESMDSKHKNTIEVTSWSWGVSQPGSMGVGGGGGTGKASFQDMHFTSHMGKSSSRLAKACATGEHIEKATLYVRKAGKEAQEFLIVTMNDVIISSYHTGGSGGGGIPIDQFSINFSEIKITYKTQQKDGTLGAAMEMGYDVKQGKESTS